MAPPGVDMWRSASRLSLLGGCCATAASVVSRAHCQTIDLDDASVRSLRASMSTAIKSVMPPVARREPRSVYFGVNPDDRSENRGAAPMDPPIEYVDDHYWIRDDDRKNEEVLSLLHAENAYTDLKTSHLAPFRSVLYDEMLSRIQEDDDEYPVPAADGYEYWARTVKGQSFKQYLRKRIGDAVAAAQVFLDVNAVPSLPFFTSNANWDAKQCDVQSIKPSPSGALLAYCVDGSGYETYNVRLKDLASGAELDETITDMAGSIAWASDTTLFYTRHDKAHRPFQVWRHEIGTGQQGDQMVFEDRDELYWVGVSTARDGSLVWIESESKETMEMHFVPTASPTDAPTVVRPREFGVKYSAESHAPSRSLFLTSNVDGKRNRELFRASLDAPSAWQPVLAPSGPVLTHSAAQSLDYVHVFDRFLAVDGRAGGFTKVWIVPLGTDGSATADAEPMRFAQEACECGLASNKLFASDGKLRVEYSDMTTPQSLFEYDVSASAFRLLKEKPVPNYDASKYATRQMRITARDGEAIPVTLFWRPDALKDGEGAPAPLHLYGYGSYGALIARAPPPALLPVAPPRSLPVAVAVAPPGTHCRWLQASASTRALARACPTCRLWTVALSSRLPTSAAAESAAITTGTRPPASTSASATPSSTLSTAPGSSLALESHSPGASAVRAAPRAACWSGMWSTMLRSFSARPWREYPLWISW